MSHPLSRSSLVTFDTHQPSAITPTAACSTPTNQLLIDNPRTQSSIAYPRVPDLEELVRQKRLQDALATLLRLRLRGVGGWGKGQRLAASGGGLYELPLKKLESLEEFEERDASGICLKIKSRGQKKGKSSENKQNKWSVGRTDEGEGGGRGGRELCLKKHR